MQNKTRLKIILYEYKLVQNSIISEYDNFQISLSFNSKTITTDKMKFNSSFQFNSGNIFYFDLPEKIDNKQVIKIKIITSSWLVFNTVICSCEINCINKSKTLNNNKRWYSMKNKENKEIMKILISISGLINEKDEQENVKLSDISYFNNTKNNQMSFISNNSCIDNDELVPKTINNTIIIKTSRYNTKTKNSYSNISSKDFFTHYYNNTNHSSFIPEKNIKQNKKENAKLKQKEENQIYKYGNKSCLLDGKYYNYADDNENGENINMNNIISLIERYKNEGGDKNAINQFMEKINKLKEKESNL